MSSNTNRDPPRQDLFLTPHQQTLLLAALNANKPHAPVNSGPNPVALSPSSFKNSPMNGLGAGLGYHESPLLDGHDYDFDDSNFDFPFANDQSVMIGDMPSTSDKSDSPEDDSHVKRIHSDDEEDGGDNDPKRRESGGKAPKKPGRKPLTSEPTTKRKAQNRAAQRAFRERKEKHLKDLETKIDDLEKASEAANHENTILRAQVDRMTAELKQYKRMLSQSKSSPQSRPQGNASLNSLNDVNFQFEFPKFGALPDSHGNKTHRPVSQPLYPQHDTQASSPALSRGSGVLSPQQSAASQLKEDHAKLSNNLSPSMSSSGGSGPRFSVDSTHYSLPGATSSPSASSNSNVGPNSSCGTSPEPYTQSPSGFKPSDTLGTIGEEQLGIANFAQQQSLPSFTNTGFDSNGLDWLTQQNGGHFEPQLFGDYREPQQSVLSNPSFDDLFSDAFDADFLTPYNTAPSTTTNLTKKTNLIAEIDAKQNSVDDEVPSICKNTNVHEMWEKLQECPNSKNGDFDLDGLCSELTKKAKCSGSGPVVGEVDFNTILRKYMGKDAAADCVASKLGLTIQPNSKTEATLKES